ncbi:hypothetical protein [Kineosporia sp. R_H_3]|uniref:hypothetical protein n=1 Tax=Kineosporia sp. R_H_3 TaxID=1961848 RepID=UPI001179F746|nr:hypothetical protein [Kineosporia sp. R_H_3]
MTYLVLFAVDGALLTHRLEVPRPIRDEGDVAYVAAQLAAEHDVPEVRVLAWSVFEEEAA